VTATVEQMVATEGEWDNGSVAGLDPESDIGFWNMSPSSAEQVTVQIRTVLDRAWEYIALAYKGRAFVALGYANWDDYVDARFGDVRISVPREHRAQVVNALAGVRMSVRAIAKLLGVGVGTVHRELSKSSAVPDGTPGGDAERPPTIGLDGKEYPARRKAIRQPCSTCGEEHPAADGECPWDLFAQGRAPHPRGGAAQPDSDGEDLMYGKPDRAVSKSKPSKKLSAPHVPGEEEPQEPADLVPAAVDFDAPLELILRMESIVDELAELSELVLALEAAIAGQERVVANVDLAGQVSRLGDDLSGGFADLPALATRLTQVAAALRTH
jgi:hypothetical protein